MGDVDVALLGASGFVGRLVAEYLAAHAPAGLRMALAGRDESRLTATRQTLGPRAADWPVLVADLADRTSLDRLAGACRLVVTTAGPYAGRGLDLVEACAAAGTDYADLTGEVLFVRDSIDVAHAAAEASGARIVHACGFDSVPSDLAVLLLHEAAEADGAGGLGETTFVLTGARGGLGGGTVATALGQLAEISADPRRARIAQDPYALSPDREAEPDRRGLRCAPDTGGPAFDAGSGRWTAPFVMAPFNTRGGRRSNALLGHSYGRDSCYREVMATGRGPVGAAWAAAASAGLGVGMRAARFGLVRDLARRALPEPGHGPGERTRQRGFFAAEVRSRTDGGASYLARVAAKGDPGFAATAVMLGETALALALDREVTLHRAGVLTPATALGRPLVDRLRSAGFTLEVRGER